MGFRFRRSIKLLPGLRINLSKTGVSTSIGRPGATINIGRGKVKATVGLPGSGLSYNETSKLGDDERASEGHQAEAPASRGSLAPVLIIVFILLVLYLMAHR